MPAKSVTNNVKKLAQDLENCGFGGPPCGAKRVVRVPIGILFSKFEAVYVKRDMESDFGLQNPSTLQKNDTTSVHNDSKNEARGSRIESKLK